MIPHLIEYYIKIITNECYNLKYNNTVLYFLIIFLLLFLLFNITKIIFNYLNKTKSHKQQSSSNNNTDFTYTITMQPNEYSQNNDYIADNSMVNKNNDLILENKNSKLILSGDNKLSLVLLLLFTIGVIIYITYKYYEMQGLSNKII